eukprot:sb/3476032/
MCREMKMGSRMPDKREPCTPQIWRMANLSLKNGGLWIGMLRFNHNTRDLNPRSAKLSPEIRFQSILFDNQNSLFRSRDWLLDNQGPVNTYRNITPNNLVTQIPSQLPRHSGVLGTSPSDP